MSLYYNISNTLPFALSTLFIKMFDLLTQPDLICGEHLPVFDEPPSFGEEPSDGRSWSPTTKSREVLLCSVSHCLMKLTLFS